MSGLRKEATKFVETHIDDEIVVMALDTGDFFSLKDTARAIWEQLDRVHDRAALVAALAADYGVGRDEIAPEVDAFLAELRGAGLLSEA
jgi:hypothetical protein